MGKIDYVFQLSLLLLLPATHSIWLILCFVYAPKNMLRVLTWFAFKVLENLCEWQNLLKRGVNIYGDNLLLVNIELLKYKFMLLVGAQVTASSFTAKSFETKFSNSYTFFVYFWNIFRIFLYVFRVAVVFAKYLIRKISKVLNCSQALKVDMRFSWKAPYCFL